MRLVETMRRLGWLVFTLMWVPFTGIFVGMLNEYGDFGRRMAASIERFLPGLLQTSGGELSPLSSICVTITIAMSFLAMALLFGSPLAAGIQNRRLLRSGLKATGRIVSVAQTGTYVNNNPMMRFMLEVQPPSGSPFHAEAERLVPLSQIPAMQPGAAVPVRYDPGSGEVAISNED